MAKVFAPASIGNVGPGFDVLGLCVPDLGDIIEVKLDGSKDLITVSGRDAELVPTDPEKNCAYIAAKSLLNKRGITNCIQIHIDRKLPLSGGLGASAASSVGGALAAAYEAKIEFNEKEILQAALDGEESVAGRHLDNLAPCLLGGFCIVSSVDPIETIVIPPPNDLWVAVVTPNIKIRTKDSRQVLSPSLETHIWTKQMAKTAALVAAFALNDRKAMKFGLIDYFAEPARSSLIPNFDPVKKAALDHGALGCSISGAGPTVFAICDDKETAEKVKNQMIKAFEPNDSRGHVSNVNNQGAHLI